MRRVPTAVLLLILAACALFLHGRRQEFADSFSTAQTVAFVKAARVITAPVQPGEPDGYLVVFDANTRIARVDAQGALRQLLKSKSAPNAGFYLANEIAAGDDGSLFVASTYINPETLAVNRECVVRYDSRGICRGPVFSRDHDEADRVDNIGLIRSLQAVRGGIQFCWLDDAAILSCRLDLASGLVETNRTPFPDALRVVQSAALSDDGRRLAFSTADAVLYAGPVGGDPQPVFDGRAVTNEAFSIPGDVRFCGEAIWFADLGRDGIAELLPGNRSRMRFDAAAAHEAGYADRYYECKAFQPIAPHRLVLANHDKIVDYDGATKQVRILSHARWNAGIWAVRLGFWVIPLIAILSLMAIGRRLAAALDEADRRMFRQALMVLAMVAAAAGLAVTMVFTNMSRRMNRLSLDTLRGHLDLGALVVDGDAVERVTHVRDYMNDDYRRLLEQLRRIITRDGEIQSGAYSGIYKVFGNKVSALAYHDGLRGIFYPYEYDYAHSIYAPVRETGAVYLGDMIDQYGVWQIGVAPIRNRTGVCVGLLEVGFDMSARREANRRLLIDTLISIAMILFVLVFLFLELGLLNAQVLGRRRVAEPDASRRYDEGAVRFAAFLSLSGAFLSAAFLPLFSQSLARPIGRVPLDLVIGFPLVVETICGATAALIRGHLRHRMGLKFDLVLGCLLAAAGLIGTAQASVYEHLLLGRCLVGTGLGLLMLAFRAYFLVEPDPGFRERGVVALTAGVVAGINVGSVTGGLLASRLGMVRVFYVQAGLMALAALFVLLMLRNRHSRAVTGTSPAWSVWQFLSNREVSAFFGFIFLPVTAAGLFLGFFFPLFGAARGCTEAEISLAFMLFGLCGVYLGPWLTQWTTQAFGPGRALAVGALVMAGGLLYFASSPTLTAAYLTVLLFGLTDSFLFNQGLGYLTSRRAVARFGEPKAMGVFHVFESAGEALGPMVFGLAMSAGLASGVALIGGALAAGAGLFWAVAKPRKEL